jgi:heme/copper-type cytochrome/quinol oxidase subunit 3
MKYPLLSLYNCFIISESVVFALLFLTWAVLGAEKVDQKTVQGASTRLRRGFCGPPLTCLLPLWWRRAFLVSSEFTLMITF